MAGRDNPFDMQIKLLMIGDSGKYREYPHGVDVIPRNVLSIENARPCGTKGPYS
jgi:hypothetical protein